MQFRFEKLHVEKRYPLQISRGTSTGSDNLIVRVSEGGFEGIGEGAPGTVGAESMADLGIDQLEDLVAWGIAGKPIVEVHALGRRLGVEPPALAALDMALWDLLGKQAGHPLWRLWGLGKPTAPTSVTIGINAVEVIRERVPEILGRTGANALKIKLGSPEGDEADREHYAAAAESAKPFGVRLRVDANGGWDVPTARLMHRWLAERECDYVEQPLPEGAEDMLPEVYRDRPLPIFVDESCRFASDVPGLADRVDGVNLKLMKCGGPTEALRILSVARAHGLSAMIGCMGETSIAISAGASLSALCDHVDLDSHFNLAPDPAVGAQMIDGVVTPTDHPGHGARLSC
jgi:muconate cycloisomerase